MEEQTNYDYINQHGIYNPQEDRTDLLMYTFYSHDVISEFRRYLKGITRDDSGKIIQIRDAIANDKGINGIMLHVELAISKLTNLSDIDEEEVYSIAKEFGHDLFNDMWINKKEWGMDNVNIMGVCNRIHRAVFLTLKRAEDGGDRTLIRGVHKSLSSTTTGSKSSSVKDLIKGIFK